MTETRFPVVLVHGYMGYGHDHPLGLGPYFPEKELLHLNRNHIIVDIGKYSSDHDRACEIFYQLMGGTVDYGEKHSKEKGHLRYGATYPRALHPNWSEENPIHLVGHSVGGTTAIELYELLCEDFFGVGSNHKWVRSIFCISSPLNGTTATYFLGLSPHNDKDHSAFGRLFLSTHHALHALTNRFPLLESCFNFHMPQWKDTWSGPWGIDHPMLTNRDTAVSTVMPEWRMERNRQLKHLDKVFLVSIVGTSSADSDEIKATVKTTILEKCGQLLVAGICIAGLRRIRRRLLIVSYVLFVTSFSKRFSQWIRKAMKLFFALTLRMQRDHTLTGNIFGLQADQWLLSDGLVNSLSMIRPMRANSKEPSMTNKNRSPSWKEFRQELLATESNMKTRKSLIDMHLITSSLLAASSSSSLSRAHGSVPTGMHMAFDRNYTSITQESNPQTPCRGVRRDRSDTHMSLDKLYEEEEDEGYDDLDDVSDDDNEETADQARPPQRRTFHRGYWYVYRREANHACSTSLDEDSWPMYTDIFKLIRHDFEKNTT